MWSSAVIQGATDQWVGDMDPSHVALLRLLTVELNGVLEQTRGETFIGTGVIVRLDGDRIYVLTAKHNLHVAGSTARIAEARLADYFRTCVRVRFTPPEGAVVSGTIDLIDLPDGVTADRGYDVAVLRVTDRAFAGAVRALAPPGGVTAMFSASTDWTQAGQTILEVRSRDDARRVLTNGRPFGRLEDPGAENHVLLQFGHGHVSRSGAYGFARRALRINQLANPTFLDTTHEGYQDVFVFDTTEASSTTAKGDSGGPVFALVPTGVRSFLVGLTLGANFYGNRTDNNPNSPVDNNAFTVVSSDRVRRFP
jgi:hypothetical protein